MSAEQNDKDLDNTEELFKFLQGRAPAGYKVKRGHMPKLTPDQAWTVIWYLGNLDWKVKDHVERCDVCGELFNAWDSGDCLDYGKAPYHFCDSCMASKAYNQKRGSRLNPDRPVDL